MSGYLTIGLHTIRLLNQSMPPKRRSRLCIKYRETRKVDVKTDYGALFNIKTGKLNKIVKITGYN